jgi:hypothetical protein
MCEARVADDKSDHAMRTAAVGGNIVMGASDAEVTVMLHAITLICLRGNLALIRR